MGSNSRATRAQQRKYRIKKRRKTREHVKELKAGAAAPTTTSTPQNPPQG